MDESTLPNRAMWWPISVVSPALGLKKDVLLAAIEKGEIPIPFQRFGGRSLVYLSSAHTLEYVKSLQLPPNCDADPEEIEEEAPFAPGFWRLAAVAALLRVQPLALLADCESGRLSISVARLGPSARVYLRARDVVVHLATLKEIAA